MRADIVERRRAAVQRLGALQASGRLDSAAVRAAAGSLGSSERSVWRWLAAAEYAPGNASAYQLSASAIEAFYASHGRCSRAWSELRAAGEEVPSLRTFQRAVAEQLSPGERAYARDGEDGRRRFEVYRRWEPAARNEVWEADHAQLDLHVLPLRGQRPARPWLTVLEDGFSRLVMGWALSLQPTTGEVLVAMHQGILVDQRRGPWGGVPQLIRFDGGREFLAHAVTRAAGELGCSALPTAAYSPHQKGKIERLHRTIGESLIATLPNYTGGPRRRNGALYAQRAPLTLAQLQTRLREFVHEYNTERVHGSLGGLTPVQKWATSAAPLDLVDAERLRWMLMADQSRRVLKDGIHFGGVIYIAAELATLGGRTVEVRYMPHDQRSIEVFYDGEWRLSRSS